MADSNYNFMNVLKNVLSRANKYKPEAMTNKSGVWNSGGRYNNQGQWVTDDGVSSNPYTGQALDPLLQQIQDTSELSPEEQEALQGPQMGPSNSPYTIADPIDTINANPKVGNMGSNVDPNSNVLDIVRGIAGNNPYGLNLGGEGIDPNSDVLDIVKGIAEDNPLQGAAINEPVEPTQLPKVNDWASRFQEPLPDRPYVPVEGEDDLIMEPDSEFEPTGIPEGESKDFYDMLGLSRRERRKLEKKEGETAEVPEVEERPGKLPEGTTPYEGRFQGDLDGDGYIDDKYLPQDTPVSEEDLKGVNVDNAPITDKGDVTSTKKESTQAKSGNYVQRAEDINAKYKKGEINRFQRNRLNRKLRREIHKNRKEFGGKKSLDKATVEMMAGPVGRYVRNYPKKLKKNLEMLKDVAPDLLSAALQGEAGGGYGGGGTGGGADGSGEWTPEMFNQTVELSNPYMNILNRILGRDRMDD